MIAVVRAIGTVEVLRTLTTENDLREPGWRRYGQGTSIILHLGYQ